MYSNNVEIEAEYYNLHKAKNAVGSSLDSYLLEHNGRIIWQKMQYELVDRNGGNDKAKAKKDLFVFWGISLKYQCSSPEKAKFNVTRNPSFSRTICFPDKLLWYLSFYQDVIGFDGFEFY